MIISSWQDICPAELKEEVLETINNLQLMVKVVKPRKSKFGDFRFRNDRNMVITINNNLGYIHGNLTFFHELAHAQCYARFKNTVKPHGSEWKSFYTNWLFKLLACNAFEKDVEKVIARHALNVKSSTCYDVELMKLIRPENNNKKLKPIKGLKKGDTFTFENRYYEFEGIRRTRYLCYRLPQKKPFAFSANALVEIVPISNN